jgi:hypothetical protein
MSDELLDRLSAVIETGLVDSYTADGKLGDIADAILAALRDDPDVVVIERDTLAAFRAFVRAWDAYAVEGLHGNEYASLWREFLGARHAITPAMLGEDGDA